MNDMDVNDHLRALEEALLTSATRRDPRRLAALLTDDFREFGSSGRIFTKAEILSELQTEAPARLQMRDFDAKPVGPGSVLVTYSLVRDAGLEDKAEIPGKPPQSLRSSLWVQREGRWQMLFHQGTPQPTMAPTRP